MLTAARRAQLSLVNWGDLARSDPALQSPDLLVCSRCGKATVVVYPLGVERSRELGERFMEEHEFCTEGSPDL
jgi:hypothetical protein